MAALLWALGTQRASAQTEALLTQYFEVPTYYNPAATGTGDRLNIRALSRLQWVGIDNAPRTFLVLAESPFRLGPRRMGGGLWVSQERIGLFDNLAFNLQLSVKLRLWGGFLSAGVQPGLLNMKFRGSEVFLPDDDNASDDTDEAIPRTDLSGLAFDLGAGLSYTRRGWYASVAMSHLTQPTVSFSSEASTGQEGSEGERRFEFDARRTLYFTTGGNIRLGHSLFTMMPSVFAATDFTYTRVMATLRCSYRQTFTFGVGYRHNDAVSAMVSANYKGFYLAYSYDYPTGALSTASNGSHEVSAGYSLKLDLGANARHRQKSIRIL